VRKVREQVAEFEKKAKANFIEPIENEQNMAAITGQVLSANLVELLASVNRIWGSFRDCRILEADYLVYKTQALKDDLAGKTKALSQAFAVLKKLSEIVKREAGGADYTVRVDEVAAINGGYRAMMDKVFELNEKSDILIKTLEDKGRILNESLDRLSTSLSDDSARASDLAKVMFLGLLAIGLIMGVMLALLITRSIISPVKRIIAKLKGSSDAFADVSLNLSTTSRQLAEGASEQAAAIEETSSSLEEMSSMTQRNAENASGANQCMSEAGRAVELANDSMNSLTSSMVEISKASEKTQKIIKTIDEIAFQTNLLALNAAVEAARAGEAGAGFAVVADEVRNLAMRAADAARDTAELIEGTVKKVHEGSGMVVKTNDEFRHVAATVDKSEGLVRDISAASQQQALGINQVNIAVTQMDKVTQQNAANAEESAAASEEMNTQAEQLKEIVASLVGLVDGSGGEKGRKRQVPEGSGASPACKKWSLYRRFGYCR
jgi:methyl-accepting chemotaxis protein